MIIKPTREDKILDLHFTNNKSSLRKIAILSGIGESDHKIVFAEIDTQPFRSLFQNRNATSFYIEKQTGMTLDPN